MSLFSKVSSLVLISGVALSSLTTVSTFAVQGTPTANTTTSETQTVKEAREKVKTAKTEIKEAKKEVKEAKVAVKKAKINHRLQKAETAYTTLIKRAEVKNLDTTKIKANIETLKTAELKLKTDLDASASKEVLTADRDAIKTALRAVRADAKALRAELTKK